MLTYHVREEWCRKHD